MQVNQFSLLNDIFKGNGKQFVIPEYQRKYNWSIKQCKKLYADITTVKKNHFLGTIVTKHYDEEDSHFSSLRKEILIDGQQRLLTFSLLIKAYFDAYIKKIENDFPTKNEADISDIKQELSWYLFNSHSIDKFIGNNWQDKVVIMPIQKEKDLFIELLNPNSNFAIDKKIQENNGKNNIYNNYFYFYNIFFTKFKKINNYSNLESEKNIFFTKLVKMYIVIISLDSTDDDPQIIFESINSTGLTLTGADLIRNYMLMNENPIRQTKLFQDYWEKIEDKVNNKELNEIINIFLCIKNGKKSNDKKIYDDFKKYYEMYDKETSNKKENILGEILIISDLFRKLKTISLDKDDFFIDISKLKMTQFDPIILVIMKLFYHDKIISLDEFNKIIKFMINYFIRRSLLNFQTGALSHLLNTIAKNIYAGNLKMEKKEKNFFYNYILETILNTNSNAFFPPNTKIKELEIWNSFYDADNCKFILQKIEETLAVGSLNDSEYTIEHIMPRNLTNEWKDELGENFDEIHKNNIDNIGNLTLITSNSNSSLKNKIFSEKRKNYIKSRFKLTTEIEKFNKWGEEEIKERKEEIINLFFKAFPYPIEDKTAVSYDTKKIYFMLKEWRSSNFNPNDVVKKIRVGDLEQLSPKSTADILPRIIDILERKKNFDVMILVNGIQNEMELEYDILKRADEISDIETEQYISINDIWFIRKFFDLPTVFEILENIFDNPEFNEDLNNMHIEFTL